MPAANSILLCLALLGAPCLAHADGPAPKGDKEAAKVIWKASAQASLALSSGNANTVNVAGGGVASRSDGWNRITLDTNGALALATIVQASDRNGDSAIEESEISREQRTITNWWHVKLRYERSLTINNFLYLAGSVLGDEPAGKRLVGGGRLGYGRQVYRSETHDLRGEVGYDLSYETYILPSENLLIHSARVLTSYGLTLTADTGVSVALEALFNLNPESTPTGDAGPFSDIRVNGNVALTTKLYKQISFRFSFTVRYDHVPAPRPPFALPYVAGFVPPAEQMDTLTETAVIVNFL